MKYHYLILSLLSVVFFPNVFQLVLRIWLPTTNPVLYSKTMWTLSLCFFPFEIFPIREGHWNKAEVWNWWFIFWLLRSSWVGWSSQWSTYLLSTLSGFPGFSLPKYPGDCGVDSVCLHLALDSSTVPSVSRHHVCLRTGHFASKLFLNHAIWGVPSLDASALITYSRQI